ncbi:MAG: hypothetical protein R3B40_27890 [Polyangiales bacterium]|nr:hypothetical protein [Myxococcales bacterium]MCB9656727.1 hypothetical protein [Sandaracinaceae bacterium]
MSKSKSRVSKAPSPPSRGSATRSAQSQPVPHEAAVVHRAESVPSEPGGAPPVSPATPAGATGDRDRDGLEPLAPTTDASDAPRVSAPSSELNALWPLLVMAALLLAVVAYGAFTSGS